MKNGTLKYYQASDVLYFFLKEGLETKSLEAAPGITVELDDKNEIIGIEILDASKIYAGIPLENFFKRSGFGGILIYSVPKNV